MTAAESELTTTKQDRISVAQSGGPLSSHLQWWVYDVTPHEHRTRFHKPIAILRASKVSIVLTTLTLTQLLSDVILTRILYEMPARFSTGTFSCLMAQLTLRTRWRALREFFVQSVEICTELERDANRELQARLEHTAQFCIRFRRMFRFFAGSNLVFTMATAYKEPRWHVPVADGLNWICGITKPEDQDSVVLGVQIGTIPVKWWVSLGLNFAFYTMMTLLIIMPTVLAVFYEAIAVRIQEEPYSLRWPRLQSAVLKASVTMEETVYMMLPGLLVMTFVMPILNTVEILINGVKADPFAVLTASHILTVFVPLCFAGDALCKMRQAINTSVYNGPWLLESSSQRRGRLGMMQASFGHGGRLRGIGIGALDRPACGNALKSWFSFVQLFHNLQDMGAKD